MITPSHWDMVYREKAPDQVSWYRQHLEKSLQLIQEAAPGRRGHDAPGTMTLALGCLHAVILF